MVEDLFPCSISLKSIMQITVILSLFLIQSFVYLAPSSASHHCGELNITCPFRLKGSRAHCTSASMEVVCEGNNTFLYFKGNKYLITEIIYSNRTIRLADPTLLSGPCPIPNQIYPQVSHYHKDSYFDYYEVSFYDYYEFSYYDYDKHLYLDFELSDPFDFVSFLNCSQPLNVSEYIPVPCLSVNSSNTYVTKYGGYEEDIGMVPNFCRTFASTITSENLTISSDVFMILQKGFPLTWKSGELYASSVKECMRKLRSRHRWNGSSLGYKIQTTLTDEIFILGCLFIFENRAKFVLEVFLTFCADIAAPLLVGRMIVAPLVIYIFLMYKYWNTFLISIDVIEKFLRRHATYSVRRYDFSDIVAITSHFREKLGQGGFGAVYKGKLFNGSLVAVKMLNDSKFSGDDFINEVATIGKIHHANIVQLIGFCSEGSKRALIYEYMPHSSLDKYIFSRSNDTTLTIEKRKEIAIGIARGIDYLHRGCEMQILHFDIKPHNILLDNNLTPKISDFGLAKLYPREYNSVMVSAARGTIGYIAPELVSRNFGTISHKSDVYSFGMLLLELAGGRKNVDPEAGSQNRVYYPSWVYGQLTQSEKDEVSNVIVEIGVIEGILAKVGLWCIQSKPTNRPSMNRVIEMLQMEEDNLEMPPKPFANITLEENPRRCSFLESGSVELSVISEEISLIE